MKKIIIINKNPDGSEKKSGKCAFPNLLWKVGKVTYPDFFFEGPFSWRSGKVIFLDGFWKWSGKSLFPNFFKTSGVTSPDGLLPTFLQMHFFRWEELLPMFLRFFSMFSSVRKNLISYSDIRGLFFYLQESLLRLKQIELFRVSWV